MKVSVVSSILAFAIVASVNAATDKIFCYYGSWAHYRPGNGKVSVEHLNPHLCTHLIYTFVGLSDSGDVKIMDPWLEVDLKALEKIVGLKKDNPKLKVLTAIGGWNEGSTKYSNMAANPTKRAHFIQSVLDFVEKWQLDGFDLDWEYPAQRGGSPADKKNFIELIKELRSAFDKKGKLLTAAVGASKHHRDASYNVKDMSKYLHYINIMAYDLHYYEDGITGQNAPLYKAATDKIPELNVNDIVEGWIKDGADPKTMVLGLGFYGKSYTLANPEKHGQGDATTGAGNEGSITKQAGVLAYSEICDNIKNQGWKEEWDPKQQVPYAYSGNQWVGYDNAKSLGLKVDLAKKHNLAGVMMWSIEQDDVRNLCGEGSYPLLTALNKQLGLSRSAGNFVPPSTAAPPKRVPKPVSSSSVPVSSPSVTVASNPSSGMLSDAPSGDCSTDRIIAADDDCQSFYDCIDGKPTNRYLCAPGTKFDKSIGACNHEDLVQC